MPGIQRVSHTHEALLNHLIANPTQSLGVVAETFGYTQAWLSCIIHSDAFQERLKEQQGQVFHHTILPLTEKMQNVAHQALDRLVERIPLEDSVPNLSRAAGDVLDRLGYAAPTKGGTFVQINQQNNQHVHTSELRGEIERARALLGRGPAPLEVASNGGRTVLALPTDTAAEAVSDPGATELGESDTAAPVPAVQAPDPGPETGGSLREESALAAFGIV